LAVLGGQVNRTLVAALQAQGVPAVGLTGADGGCFSVHRHAPDGRDLGYVGEVHHVAPHLLETLLAADFVPVLASVAPLDATQNDPADHLYNVNADSAAAPLAAALKADVLLLLTDVPGVLGAEGELLSELSPDDAAELEQLGVLEGGMLPKVRAALAASTALSAGRVKIAPADGPSALLAALEPGVGTTITASLSSQGATHHEGATHHG
ncbi:MAG: acetylglutamate kinase, partial [Planctomycetota bacterium]